MSAGLDEVGFVCCWLNDAWLTEFRGSSSPACTFLSITTKQRDDAELYVSSLVLSQICSGSSPGQLLDIKASPDCKWTRHDVIAGQCPHALLPRPLIQHRCITLTLARRVDPSISCSKCGSLWKATVERCERVPLLR